MSVLKTLLEPTEVCWWGTFSPLTIGLQPPTQNQKRNLPSAHSPLAESRLGNAYILLPCKYQQPV